jgi:GNAT superfamily N-acetyltransferase
MPDTLSIRPLAKSGHATVRDLFIAINRALAPEDMKETFDRYIETALAAEIDRLASFYDRERGNGFWVAHIGPLLVGTVGLERAAPQAIELRRMYVRAEFRRRGIAQALLERVTAEARAMGYRTLVLSTAQIHAAAVAFYRALGFRHTHTDVAAASTSKTVAGLTRLYLEKQLDPMINCDPRL